MHNAGRREVKGLPCNYKVPTSVPDDGTVVDGSQRIIEWVKLNPAQGSSGRS